MVANDALWDAFITAVMKRSFPVMHSIGKASFVAMSPKTLSMSVPVLLMKKMTKVEAMNVMMMGMIGRTPHPASQLASHQQKFN